MTTNGVDALSTFPNFSDYKTQGKLAYANAVKDWLASLLIFQIQMNNVVAWFKTLAQEVDSNAIFVSKKSDEALNHKNAAYASQQLAESAAQRAESVVIPTESTYNRETIDNMFATSAIEILEMKAQLAQIKF